MLIFIFEINDTTHPTYEGVIIESDFTQLHWNTPVSGFYDIDFLIDYNKVEQIIGHVICLASDAH